MTVSDNPILGEGLQDFFKNLGKQGLNLSKNMAKNVLKTPLGLRILQQTLLVQLQVQILQMHNQHFWKYSTSITKK